VAFVPLSSAQESKTMELLEVNFEVQHR
jgi:hypothetical protein